MSTPITFSGFNNIDFNLVVNSLMQQASQPLTSLQTQQKALQIADRQLRHAGLARRARCASAADGPGTPGRI